MKTFNFDKQGAARLYRQWYLESKKDISSPYDKDQIEDLRDYLYQELGGLIHSYCSQKKKYYTATLPILFIGEKKFETFPNDILVIKNTIQSTNMPGCMAVGDSIEEAYHNYLSAIIECADARYRNGFGFMNIVHTISNYAIPAHDINRADFIAELREFGWTKEYNGTYNTVLLQEGNKVTYTVPKKEIIIDDMVLWFRQLRFQISARQFKIENLKFPDTTNWSCDACDGDYTTGCLLSDPSNCIKP